ncbi:hypothetical protein F53441_4894 [Fusarium austroafricanum]|uniref:Uncharacterized protein n=1 Tax=Fusarium austroafricanum TaxID=2364996 RepID=A0A8H4NV14_9HYPO|nr:hypothetical protein F53441_4894 [Fusarium austroafricanum]
MPVANPTTSSQPEESETPGSRPMSRLEIGLMVGSIVFFVTLIFSIFLVRALDKRHRLKSRMRRAEEARNTPRSPGEEQLRHWLAWLRIERIKRNFQFQWVDEDNNPIAPPFHETVQRSKDSGISMTAVENPNPQSRDGN